MAFSQFENFEIKLPFTPDKRPNKVHIGLVQLANDHTLETDWSYLLNNQAALFSTRIEKENGMTPETLDRVALRIGQGAQLVAQGLAMDVMAFACTSASFIIGEEKVAQLLTQGRDAIPTTNPWTATKAAFRHLGAAKIAVFSPYPTEINYALQQQLIQSGFELVALTALGIMDDNLLHTPSLDTLEAGIEALLNHREADVIFMSCTSLRVVEHIQYLEDKYHIPIVSSNSALFWHAMQLGGKAATNLGFGQLLKG